MLQGVLDTLIDDFVEGDPGLPIERIDTVKGLFFHANGPADRGQLLVGSINFEFFQCSITQCYCNQIWNAI